MLNKLLFTLSVGFFVLFSSSVARADSVVLGGRAGTGVTAQVTNYSLVGNVFTFTIRNTSTAPNATGTITNIGFNLPGTPDFYGFRQTAGSGTYYFTEDIRANTTGINTTLDCALLTSQGNNFNGGKVANGIGAGEFATFQVSGNFSGLTADQIASSMLARFQAVNGSNSDLADFDHVEPSSSLSSTPTPSCPYP